MKFVFILGGKNFFLFFVSEPWICVILSILRQNYIHIFCLRNVAFGSYLRRWLLTVLWKMTSNMTYRPKDVLTSSTNHLQCSRYFFFQTVSYWSNLKPVSVGPKWDSRISIHFADNLIVIDSDIIIIYILCLLSANRTHRSVLIFHNNWCVIWLWLIYGFQSRKVLGFAIKLNYM